MLGELPVDAAIPLARAFTHFLNLANVAEQHHRIRRRRAYQRDPDARRSAARATRRSPRLVAGGVTPDALHDAVCALRIELVLTAHPTEVSRRTLIQKYNRIAALLAERDRPDLTVPERDEVAAALRREIEAAWETDEVRQQRPTPLDEVRSGLIVFEQSLWDALPRFLRERRSRAARRHRPRAAARRRAGALRLVDWRRPRRQPERDAGGDAAGVPAVALDGRRPLSCRRSTRCATSCR